VFYNSYTWLISSRSRLFLLFPLNGVVSDCTGHGFAKTFLSNQCLAFVVARARCRLLELVPVAMLLPEGEIRRTSAHAVTVLLILTWAGNSFFRRVLTHAGTASKLRRLRCWPPHGILVLIDARTWQPFRLLKICVLQFAPHSKPM
jgi:hypothetical protein